MLWALLTLVDWAVIAVSLFNTVAMLWLGLTVLLNAERRTWATYAAGGGLMLGGAFFAGHSVVVGRELGGFEGDMELWWRLGWVVLIAAPYAWYAVMASYAGVLRAAGRHRLGLLLAGCLGGAALALMLIADPVPSYDAVVGRGGAAARPPGAPAVALFYPVYSVTCIALALWVLRTPGESDRFMGDLARRRARPWLVAASLALLAVSLAVGGAAAWLLELFRAGSLPRLSLAVFGLLLAFDLLVALLIAAATLLIGQAVVAYEIFTGSALPRGALARQWRRCLIFAGGLGASVGWSMSGASGPLEPSYQVVLAVLVATAFFAMLGWRSYADRQRTVAGLRPFVGSQRTYERALAAGEAPAADAAAPFAALCGEILGARVGFLCPVGPMAPLAGPGLAFPPGLELPPGAAEAAAARIADHDTICAPVEPAASGGAVWAIPLWGERGLIGMLLLGEKRDGGVYTREEIEVARAAGERLIDSQAGAELARRLASLQRRHMAESQVLDRRARRVLHDEVLPQIHAAMIALGGDPASQGAVGQLMAAHRQIANLLHELPAAPSSDVVRAGLLGALRAAVEEFAPAFDSVEWRVEPAAEAAARLMAPLSAETVFFAAREAVRNAARYGRGGREGPLGLALELRLRPGGLELAVEDSGVGLGAARPGGGGSGRGLALHSTMLAIIGGALSVESEPGRFTRVRIAAPLPQG